MYRKNDLILYEEKSDTVLPSALIIYNLIQKIHYLEFGDVKHMGFTED